MTWDDSGWCLKPVSRSEGGELGACSYLIHLRSIAPLDINCQETRHLQLLLRHEPEVASGWGAAVSIWWLGTLNNIKQQWGPHAQQSLSSRGEIEGLGYLVNPCESDRV